ncbi:hypothetical protein GOV10_01215, partial [Candidatus Woesearchaeota archaeon]|nr:hypothetical protein [Candidatus Woesearchaeota archaeon]
MKPTAAETEELREIMEADKSDSEPETEEIEDDEEQPMSDGEILSFCTQEIASGIGGSSTTN